MKEYRILGPELGFHTMKLHQDWRDRQGKDLELVAIAETQSARKATKREEDIFGKGTGRRNEEQFSRRRILVFLIETDGMGISRRLGLYHIDKQLWGEASKVERMVYLC